MSQEDDAGGGADDAAADAAAATDAEDEHHDETETLETSATSSNLLRPTRFEDVRIVIRRLLSLCVAANTSGNNTANKQNNT